MNLKNTAAQHSATLSLFLHLMPGFLIGAAYFALRPLVQYLEYPSLMALMCTIIVVLVPLELGDLLYEGRKRNGRFSLQGVVLYRTAISGVECSAKAECTETPAAATVAKHHGTSYLFSTNSPFPLVLFFGSRPHAFASVRTDSVFCQLK